MMTSKGGLILLALSTVFAVGFSPPMQFVVIKALGKNTLADRK